MFVQYHVALNPSCIATEVGSDDFVDQYQTLVTLYVVAESPTTTLQVGSWQISQVSNLH